MCSRTMLRGGALMLLLLGATQASAAQTTAAAGWQATPASMLKSALRTATAAQVRYFQAQGTYATSAEALSLTGGGEVRVRILGAGPRGWQARAVHVRQPGRSCVIFVGSVEGMESPSTDGDHEMAGEEGVPLCDMMR